MDLADTSAVRDTVAFAVEELGKVDILVNSRGTNTPLRLLKDLSDGEWYRVIDTNLRGPYRLTTAILPQMRSQGGGLIVHI